MNEKVVYIHIPKTAGTAFRRALVKMVGMRNVYWIGANAHPVEEWPAVTPGDLAPYKVVCGHKRYLDYREKISAQEATFVTLLRDPIRRAVSYYQFIKSRAAHNPLASKLKEHDLHSAIKVPAFRDLISNTQCQFIAGVPSFAAAEQEIENADWMIGIDSNVDGLLRRISDRFDWPPVQADHRNVSSQGYFEDLCTTEIAEAIRELNREDLQLFEKYSAKSAS